MQPIPRPELLDPARALSNERDDFTVADHKARSQLLADALKDSCEYAQQLWEELDGVRAYLVRALPDDPGRADARRGATAPTGPDDEEGWTDWMATYAAVTSVMCGPHGDSGFGADQARHEAYVRRVAPVPVACSLVAPDSAAAAPGRRWARAIRAVRRKWSGRSART